MRDPIAPGPLLRELAEQQPDTGLPLADLLVKVAVILVGLASVGAVAGYLPWSLRKLQLWKR